MRAYSAPRVTRVTFSARARARASPSSNTRVRAAERIIAGEKARALLVAPGDKARATLTGCAASLSLHYGNISDPRAGSPITELAARDGRTIDEIVSEAIDRYLKEDVRFVEAVMQGLASLDGGEFVSQEEVGKRIERLFEG
jgi:predicted transcriptional regulator